MKKIQYKFYLNEIGTPQFDRIYAQKDAQGNIRRFNDAITEAAEQFITELVPTSYKKIIRICVFNTNDTRYASNITVKARIQELVTNTLRDKPEVPVNLKNLDEIHIQLPNAFYRYKVDANNIVQQLLP
ncbi:hypothetical protein AD998_20310 [bacterium 336/3]|nr:hypothetical protein AD998_20310 [bacterium 336/3]